MSTDRKNKLAEIMTLAWSFVKKNGFTMAEALKVAWLNAKTKTAMLKGVAEFYFTKVDGSIRQSFGTLRSDLTPATAGGNRKTNDGVQVYFDVECNAFRSFRKCNLIKVM